MSAKIYILKFCEGGNRADKYGTCEVETCKACCVHSDMDRYECPDCGYSVCPGELIDAATDYWESKR